MRKLLLLLTISGCGFTGEKPFAGARSEDVAPWDDLGAVTFCQAETRIGSPASKPGGLCTDGTAPASCTADGDCRSRERCACGRCQILLCDSGDECRPGQVCSFGDRRCDTPCTSDGECAAGETCLPGVGLCRGNCGSDPDCQSGERCDTTDGKCVTEPCTSDASCINNPTCTLQRIPGILREPSPIYDGKQVVMYIERVEGITSTIWRATSPDGLTFRFDPERPVIVPDASDGTRAGAVAIFDGGLLLVAIYANANGALRAAHSEDGGLNFTVLPAPVLVPSASWEQSGLDSPSLALGDRRLFLYYATVDRTAFGVADSDLNDVFVFTRHPDPVLRPSQVIDPILWRGIDAIASPFAERATSPDGKPFLRIYFAARGRESAASIQFGQTIEEAPNFSIGAASTLDGTTLVPWPFNPTFDRTQNFLTHPAELEPAVVKVGERRLLYYRGAAADDTRSTNLSVAQNPVPVR